MTKDIIGAWWYSSTFIAAISRIAALFLLFWVLFAVGSWTWYQFTPRSWYYTYHDVIGVGLDHRGFVVAESHRDILWSAEYEFTDRMQCRNGVGGWQAEGTPSTTTAVMPRGGTPDPPGRWRFRGSLGVFTGVNPSVGLPAECRFVTLVVLGLPFGVRKAQTLVGSVFVIEEADVAP